MTALATHAPPVGKDGHGQGRPWAGRIAGLGGIALAAVPPAAGALGVEHLGCHSAAQSHPTSRASCAVGRACTANLVPTASGPAAPRSGPALQASSPASRWQPGSPLCRQCTIRAASSSARSGTSAARRTPVSFRGQEPLPAAASVANKRVKCSIADWLSACLSCEPCQPPAGR